MAISAKVSKKLGILKKNGIHKVAIKNAKKLFKKRILKTVSRPDKILIQIISKPIINAPHKHRRAIGLIFKLLDGLINNKPPTREMMAADQRTQPTFSFRINIEKIIANIGFRKFIAVASLAGMYNSAVNQIEIPNTPNNERKIWSLIFDDFKLGFKKGYKKNRSIKAKKNLACAIWRGWTPSPKKEFPNILVKILPHAKENDAAIINNIEYELINKHVLFVE